MPLIDRIYFDPSVTGGRAFAATSGEKTKEALAKIGQIIPGEILGAYGAALGAVPLWGKPSQPWIALFCFLLGLVGTGWYVGWIVGKGFKRQKHVFVYMGAFAVWAYSLTGETALKPIYHPGIAVLAPIVAGVILSKIKLPKKEVR
jgi:hypothetical protein